MHRKALGKGLDALFGAPQTEDAENTEQQEVKAAVRRIASVRLNDIIPNRSQPREHFSDEAMEELKQSIAENGILEPPVVRRKGDFYELVAGERRFRAAKELGFEFIDVIIMDVSSDDKMLVFSLIENIQRENLNAIEEAKAFRSIMERMSVTQEELSEIVGKSRSTVANTLRLLNLPEQVRMMVADGTLAPGSARPLVAVQDKALQFKLAQKISSEGLSARKAEALVKQALTDSEKEKPRKEISPFLRAICDDMRHVLGTDVKFKGNDTRGRIEIAYYTRDDLERILDVLRGGID